MPNDSGLTLPKIDTVVYTGRDEDGVHLFQDAASHAAQQQGVDADEIIIVGFADDNLCGIVDKDHLIEWLQDEHDTKSVGPTYKYREVD